MDYLNHFGLENEPFANAPVNRFYFHSTQHDEALKRLVYIASSMKGLAVCIGNIGHGKTTLARRLLDHLLENDYEAAMLIIVHEGVSATWLLRRIAMQLGVADPGEEKLTIINRLYQRLVEIHEAGRKAVVIIDEAQMLASKEIMEEFRGLLNIELPGHKLLSFVFFGLQELEQYLMLDPPLAQRVALKYRLRPFDEANTDAYIKFRLEQAGSTQTIFTPGAVTAVHNASKGIPRVINTICDNALLEAYLNGDDIVTAELVNQVAENLGALTITEEKPVVIPQPEPAPENYLYQPVPSPNAANVTVDIADAQTTDVTTINQNDIISPVEANNASDESQFTTEQEYDEPVTEVQFSTAEISDQISEEPYTMEPGDAPVVNDTEVQSENFTVEVESPETEAATMLQTDDNQTTVELFQTPDEPTIEENQDIDQQVMMVEEDIDNYGNSADDFQVEVDASVADDFQATEEPIISADYQDAIEEEQTLADDFQVTDNFQESVEETYTDNFQATEEPNIADNFQEAVSQAIYDNYQEETDSVAENNYQVEVQPVGLTDYQNSDNQISNDFQSSEDDFQTTVDTSEAETTTFDVIENSENEFAVETATVEIADDNDIQYNHDEFTVDIAPVAAETFSSDNYPSGMEDDFSVDVTTDIPEEEAVEEEFDVQVNSEEPLFAPMTMEPVPEEQKPAASTIPMVVPVVQLAPIPTASPTTTGTTPAAKPAARRSSFDFAAIDDLLAGLKKK